jgi:hypothetical protein
MRTRTLCVVAAMGVLAAVFPMLAGPAMATNIGDDHACTPGYWKTHPGDWPVAGVTDPTETDTVLPGGKLIDYFQLPVLVAPGTGTPVIPVALRDLNGDGYDDTMMQALGFSGGPGVMGASRILMRAATAAYLNAADERLFFPLRRREDIVIPVRDALASGDRMTIVELAEELDWVNNSLPCPLGGMPATP